MTPALEGSYVGRGLVLSRGSYITRCPLIRLDETHRVPRHPVIAPPRYRGGVGGEDSPPAPRRSARSPPRCCSSGPRRARVQPAAVPPCPGVLRRATKPRR